MATANDKQKLVVKLLQEKQRIKVLERELQESKEFQSRLRKSEEERLIYLNRMRRGLLVLDARNRICTVNPAACQLFHCRESRIMNQLWPWPGLSFINDQGDLLTKNELPWHSGSVPSKDISQEMGIRMNGSMLFWADVQTEPVFNEAGGMYVFFDNRTAQKEAEFRLKQSEEKYRTIFENIQDVYFEISMAGYIEVISPSVLKLGKAGPKSFIGHSIDELFSDRKERIRIFDLIMAEGQIEDEIVWVQWRDAQPRACSIMASLIRDKNDSPMKIVGSLRDITKRVDAEKQLQKDLEEKEILLREIHHRVKNNMAIITSLLKLQADAYPHPEIQAAFQDLKNRILSMSLVHEHLYLSDQFSMIHMANYLKSLVDKVTQSYKTMDQSIQIEYEIQTVTLKISAALYSGLIVNELVSNALKYAFVGRKKQNLIKIAMHRKKETVVLEVVDNGIGLPADVELEKAESLGLKLVTLLSREQLQGDIQIRRGQGTHFIIQFKTED